MLELMLKCYAIYCIMSVSLNIVKEISGSVAELMNKLDKL